MVDKNIKNALDNAIDLVIVYTDLQRTYHNCHMHNDTDACSYIDEKIANVKAKQKQASYFRREIPKELFYEYL